ncbi:MAG TPA: tetratricopeptide repeat protein [Streptosporangiaceae bacterium]|nr:tetratricopeptide repeat protein [Streptosporangiaceae bacterium]
MEPQALSTQLPEEPNRFIGRERELDDLRLALRRARALTLCGAGGIGKTRLALRLLAAVSRDFADGVCVVELGDVWEPDLIVSRMASLIGIDGEAGRALLDTLADALETRQVLVVLDNCEHLVDACAALCQRLLVSCPRLRILATSQEPLRIPQEAVWQVTPLAVPPPGGLPDARELAGYEAVRLFADRAAAARPGFAVTARNAMAVAAVCRALDGVPLAIELAAARVNVLSAEQIAARIGDRFTLLGSGDRTAPPRQRTLRATIDWSHGLLSAQEQALLRRVSVFAGWSLEMAEQVCADEMLPADEIIDLTAALVDKSLVVVEPEVLGQARYRLLDSIRAYAAQRLAEAGEAAAFQLRFRDYALAVTEHGEAVGMAVIPAGWAAAVDVFRRYDVDAGNLRQVLSRCLATGDVATGLRICTAVRPCWIVRGYFAEGEEWFARFLALDHAALDHGGLPAPVLGAALIGRAQLVMPNAAAQAQAWAREGLELCRQAGQLIWTATALNLLAEADLHAGRLEAAADAAAQALATAREAGNAWNEGYALGTQATLAATSGRLREARQLGEAALDVMRGIDQQWGVARTLLGLGALARLRRDAAGAIDCYRAALPTLREIDSRPDIARCLAGIGRVALDQGQLALAREHLAESLRLSRLTGARIGVARGLEAFAALTAREGRSGLPVVLIAAASALRKAAGLPPLPTDRVQQQLDPARSLGMEAFTRLWEQGLGMTPDGAVALALSSGPRAADEPAADAADAAVDAVDAEPGAAGPANGTAAAPDRVTPVAGLSALPSLAPGSTLTPREREIAALIAHGHSNKALADELVISPATAARHVANILAKLGFTSRAQIAAWAAGNGSIQPSAAHERGSLIR